MLAGECLLIVDGEERKLKTCGLLPLPQRSRSVARDGALASCSRAGSQPAVDSARERRHAADAFAGPVRAGTHRVDLATTTGLPLGGRAGRAAAAARARLAAGQLLEAEVEDLRERVGARAGAPRRP